MIFRLTKEDLLKKDVLEEMRKKYNGYKFYSEGNGEKDNAMFAIFNPFSVMKFLERGQLLNHWYESGTTELLKEQMLKEPKRFDIDFDDIHIIATQDELKFTSNQKKIDLKSLMFQTGYLTINSYDVEKDQFHLKYPNQEVKEAFEQDLIKLVDETIKEAKTTVTLP